MIKSMIRSTITNNNWYKSMLAGNPAYTDYELISTTVLGGTAASVTFSSLGTYSSTYKHLQLRVSSRTTESGGSVGGQYSRLNGDSGNNYAGHFLFGNGSSVGSSAETSQPWAITGLSFRAGSTANAFAASVIDLLDPFQTTKNKTFRTLSGLAADANRIDLHSGLWMNTASVTSWQILPAGANFAAGSRFSLYGIKG
jgi:hypothetical protein